MKKLQQQHMMSIYFNSKDEKKLWDRYCCMVRWNILTLDYSTLSCILTTMCIAVTFYLQLFKGPQYILPRFTLHYNFFSSYLQFLFWFSPAMHLFFCVSFLFFFLFCSMFCIKAKQIFLISVSSGMVWCHYVYRNFIF